MWKYHSPIGELSIKYIPSQQVYGFFYKNQCWGAANNPQALADNVYVHCSGCYDWDKLDGEVDDCPTDLSEWIRC